MKFNRYLRIRKNFTHHRINVIGVMSCFLMTKTATRKHFAIVNGSLSLSLFLCGCSVIFNFSFCQSKQLLLESQVKS
jgi:hypothetical protein